MESSSFDPGRFNHLNEAQILGRIGGLLAIALVRSGRLSGSASCGASTRAKTDSAALDPVALIRDPAARRIAQFLKIAGPATPGEIALALGLTRRTLARKLFLLRRSGICTVAGKTRAACYEFRTEFADN